MCFTVQTSWNGSWDRCPRSCRHPHHRRHLRRELEDWVVGGRPVPPEERQALARDMRQRYEAEYGFYTIDLSWYRNRLLQLGGPALVLGCGGSARAVVAGLAIRTCTHRLPG